jgi:hypothetical protein
MCSYFQNMMQFQIYANNPNGKAIVKKKIINPLIGNGA